MSDAETVKRYLGSRPYEDTSVERAVFFGRDREKAALLDKILAEDVVVLHGKSGLGKTSLLNAGVFQLLRENHYWPALLRLNDPAEDPVEAIRKRFVAQTEEEVDYFSHQQADHLTDLVEGLEIWTDNEPLVPILVLDQFEELFTLWDAEGRDVVFREISELMRRKRASRLEANPTVKLVLSLREDFLGELESLSAEIPQIAYSRFRLEALRPEQAREAIREPARLDDDRLDTPRFFYYSDTIDRLLDFLRKKWQRAGMVAGDEIEPSQLQILCQEIERRATEDERTYITPRDLGGEAGMRRIIRGYYQSKIQTFDKAARPRIRRLCEAGLISKRGRRLPLGEDEIIDDYGVTPDELRKLVDLRLLRVDPRLGDLFYELSHDSLVVPILEARNAREEAFRRAQTHLHKGHPELAAKLIEQALDEEIEDGRLFHLGGRALAERLDYKGALELYEKALETSPDKAAIFLDIGDAYRSYRPRTRSIDPYEKALEAYQEARRLDPDDATIRRKIALLRVESGDIEGALREFEEAVAEKPRPGFFEELVEELRKRREVDAALQFCRRALKVRTGSAVYYFNVAWELDYLGDHEAALKAWKASWNQEKDPGTLLNWGNTLASLKRYTEADAKYRQALELEPDYVDAYFNWGVNLSEQGQFEAATEKFRQTLKLDGLYSEALFEWGNALAGLERWKEAIEKFEQTLEQQPDHLDAMLNWGDALRALGRTEYAIDKYREALVTDGSSVEAVIRLAECLVETGQQERATDLLRGATKSVPDSAELAAGLAWTLLQSGEHQEAEDRIREALDIEPRSVSMRGRLALVLAYLGKLPEAEREYLETLRQAVRQEEPDEFSGVLDELQEALGRQPDLPGAAELLSKLQARVEQEFPEKSQAGR